MTSPGGYHVGTAFIQILPSFQHFHRRAAAEMSGLRDVKVNVEPQIAMREAQRAVAGLESRLAKPTSKPLDLDLKKFNAKLAEISAKRAALVIAIDGNLSKLHAKIEALERSRPTATVDVDADIAKARAEIAHLTAKRDTITINADVDSARAESKMRELERGVSNLKNSNVDIGIEAEDASRTIAMMGLLTAAIGAVGAAAPAAAAAVALIPSALLSAGQAFAAVKAGFSGIGDATKAMQAVEDETTTKASANAGTRAASANRVASANASLQRALENVDQAASSGARQVTAAREGLADAVIAANRRVETAEETLASAQRGAQAAQEALTQARKEAQEQLEDLSLSLSGAALDEEDAVLRAQDAHDKLDKARAAGTGGRDMQKIDLAARQADQALAEVSEHYVDIQEESAEAARVGVAGNAGVLSAQRQVEDSTRDVQGAERDLAQARQDGARQVQKAEQQVAEAQRSSAQAQADAAHQVEDAQRAVGEASVAASGTASAAMGKLELAMANLTPAGREFATFMQNELKPALKGIGEGVQSALLPHMQNALQQLMVLAPEVTSALTDTGNIIGNLAEQGAEMVTAGPWRKDFGTIMASNNRILASMGQSGLSTIDMFKNLTVAAGPLAERFWDNVEATMDTVAAWVQGKRDSGELTAMLIKMETSLKELWGVFKQVTGGVWDVVSALAPLGMTVLKVIGFVAELIGNFAEANPVIAQIIGWVIVLTSGFLTLGRTIGGMRKAVTDSITSYRSTRAALFGLKDGTDAAGKSIADTTAKTKQLGAATQNTGGLFGRIRGGLAEVGTAYSRGGAAAERWATGVTTTTGRVASTLTSRLAGSAAAAAGSLNSFLPSTGRVEGAFKSLAGAAGTSMSAVSKVVGGAASAAATAGAGLMSALGGPWGLVLAAASIGLGLFASAQAQSAAETAEATARIEGMTSALVESNGAVDASVRKQLNDSLQKRSLIDNTKHLGLSYGEMTRAILEGGKASDTFTESIRARGEVFIKDAGVSGDMADQIRSLTGEMLRSGGKASDYSVIIEDMTRQFQRNTGATNESTAKYREHLQEYLDLAGGFRDNQNEFRTAAENAQLIAEGEDEAAGATRRHYDEVKKLSDVLLGQISKQLAYESAQNSLTSAQQRTADALAESGQNSLAYKEALNAEQQQIISVIEAAGAYAASISTSTDESIRGKEATAASAQAAADLANKYGGTLPAALQTYLTGLGVVKDATGTYVATLDTIPPTKDTTLTLNTEGAQQAAKDYKTWFDSYMNFVITPAVKPPPGSPTGGLLGNTGGGAFGAIVRSFGSGGFHRPRAMRGGYAQIVPPRTYRVIGDRRRGDEAYVPINHAPRSQAILGEAASRMGFGLVPMALGGVLHMAGGGTVSGGGGATAPAGAGVMPGIPLTPEAVDALAAALIALTTGALAGLAAEIALTTVPALLMLENHAGVLSVNAILNLGAQLPVLRMGFGLTSAAVALSWAQMTSYAWTSVTGQNAALAALRAGMSATQTAMTNTADWAVSQWGRMKAAASDPVRWVLQFPFNAGIIAAWNRLNTDFGMNKPVAPVAIPFKVGGRVPGVGSGDKVRAFLEPGEIVFDKSAIANLGGVAKVERMRLMARAGIIGPDQRLGGRPGDAGERLRLMRTVPLDGLGFAYGGVQPHVAAAGAEIEQKFGRLPGGIGGVGSRGNVSDHPGGLALDFMTMRDSALGSRIAGYLQTNAQRMLIKYLIWQQKMNEGAGWEPMEDRGSLTANHMDHVHTSFLSAGQGGHMFNGEGAALDPATYFTDTRAMLAKIPGMFPNNMMATQAGAVASAAVDGALAAATVASAAGGVTGNVESWRPLVMQALQMLGLPAGWADITLKRMSQESGGNPRAINLTDVNAQRGDPSKGLMQVIGGTFRANRDSRAPDDVWDPLANVLASMKYAMNRYGSLPAAYGRPGGYDKGGLLPPGYSTVYNGTSRPEVVMTDAQTHALVSLAAQGTSGGDFRGNLYLDSGELLGVVQGQINRANADSGLALTRRLR
jgi:hypothetical protein